MSVSIELSLEEGELFQQAVDKASVRLSAETSDSVRQEPNDKAAWTALQADAAMLIVRDYLSGQLSVGGNDEGSPSTSSADNYQVVVHVDEQALVKGETGDELSSGASELPMSTVRRLCCDGSIIPIIENAKGEPLNVGRKVRTLTTSIRRALWARDKGCVFPGCHCKRYVDGHHNYSVPDIIG